MAAESSADAGRFCRRVAAKCGGQECRSEIQARNRRFSTQKTAKSCAECALRKQQKHTGVSQSTCHSPDRLKMPNIFKRYRLGGKPVQALTHLQKVIRKLPELDPPIESLLPRRT